MKMRQYLLAISCLALFACTSTEVVNDSGDVVDTSEIKQKRVTARVNAAKQYIAAGNFDRARVHLSRALEEDPKSAEAYEGLALVFQSSGEIKLAEENYDKAMKFGGENTRIKNNYAWFLFQQGHAKEAREIQLTVVEDIFYENRSLALYNLGLMELNLNLMAEAERSFVRAKSASMNFAAAYIELAEIYFDQKNYQQANEMLLMYRKYTEHSARSAWLGIRLARVFGDRQQEKSLALMMKNKFSTTNEYLAYKDSLNK